MHRIIFGPLHPPSTDLLVLTSRPLVPHQLRWQHQKAEQGKLSVCRSLLLYKVVLLTRTAAAAFLTHASTGFCHREVYEVRKALISGLGLHMTGTFKIIDRNTRQVGNFMLEGD